MPDEEPIEPNPLQTRLSGILEYGSPVFFTPERVSSLVEAAFVQPEFKKAQYPQSAPRNPQEVTQNTIDFIDVLARASNNKKTRKDFGIGGFFMFDGLVGDEHYTLRLEVFGPENLPPDKRMIVKVDVEPSKAAYDNGVSYIPNAEEKKQSLTQRIIEHICVNSSRAWL